MSFNGIFKDKGWESRKEIVPDQFLQIWPKATLYKGVDFLHRPIKTHAVIEFGPGLDEKNRKMVYINDGERESVFEKRVVKDMLEGYIAWLKDDLNAKTEETGNTIAELEGRLSIYCQGTEKGKQEKKPAKMKGSN